MLPSIHVNDVTDILLHRSHKCMDATRLRYLKFPSRRPAGDQSHQKQAWFQDRRVKKFENESDSGSTSGECGGGRAEIPTSDKMAGEQFYRHVYCLVINWRITSYDLQRVLHHVANICDSIFQHIKILSHQL